jgi:hypothetical protein
VGQRIGGVAVIKIDGTQYALKGNMTVSPSSKKRDGVAGQDYVHGFLENPIVPSIRGDFSTVPGISADVLQAMTDVTVQADLANGNSYVLQDAWTEAAFVIDSVRGQLEVIWQGLNCDELVGANAIPA